MRLSFLVESPILYLAFFKTILAALFRAFGLPLSFLPSKPSFLHDHSTTQHSDFSSFLAISTTDKPVNRSILQAHAFTQLNVFALRGFIFRDIHKKRKEFEQFVLWNTKNVWLENILKHLYAPLVRKYTNRLFQWKEWSATSMKMVNSYWKTPPLLKWFAHQVQLYWNTD